VTATKPQTQKQRDIPGQHQRWWLGETYYIRPMSWNNLDELWTIKAEVISSWPASSSLQ
jgi:hypothetical protein